MFMLDFREVMYVTTAGMTILSYFLGNGIRTSLIPLTHVHLHIYLYSLRLLQSRAERVKNVAQSPTKVESCRVSSKAP